jgi:hypothetical protein
MKEMEELRQYKALAELKSREVEVLKNVTENQEQEIARKSSLSVVQPSLFSILHPLKHKKTEKNKMKMTPLTRDR